MDLTWENVEGTIRDCHSCKLCIRRTLAVPGEGCRSPQLLCIGEGPGEQEDLQGRPFVGPAGQLLDKMLAAIGQNRETCYIANVVKCRPPGNRNPEPDEIEACLPYLRAQLRLLHPKIILILGAVAGRALISPDFRITRDRGRWIERKGFWMLATYHPSYLLRTPQAKKEAWADLQTVQRKLEELKEGRGVNG